VIDVGRITALAGQDAPERRQRGVPGGALRTRASLSGSRSSLHANRHPLGHVPIRPDVARQR